VTYIVKADQKTILLIAVAIIDCIVGGVIIASTINNKPDIKAEPKEPAKLIALSNELNYEESELLAYVEVEEVEEIVFDGMTLTELSAKLDRSLKNELKGKGTVIATYSLKKGVDPYIVTAIMLHETGCTWNCSRIAKQCNNVGGIKGKGCGKYASYDSLDSGIKALINNLYKNYFSKGLTTPEQINPKYAESKTWKNKINDYVKKIKKA
jgi:Mannosyl-glycoprotein endo-beta-N-acetylglucosaminidase.